MHQHNYYRICISQITCGLCLYSKVDNDMLVEPSFGMLVSLWQNIVQSDMLLKDTLFRCANATD